MENDSEGVLIGLLKDEEVSIEESKDLEEVEGVGGKGDAEEGEKSDDLVEISERPQRLHRRLAE